MQAGNHLDHCRTQLSTKLPRQIYRADTCGVLINQLQVPPLSGQIPTLQIKGESNTILFFREISLNSFVCSLQWSR